MRHSRIAATPRQYVPGNASFPMYQRCWKGQYSEIIGLFVPLFVSWYRTGQFRYPGSVVDLS